MLVSFVNDAGNSLV